MKILITLIYTSLIVALWACATNPTSSISNQTSDLVVFGVDNASSINISKLLNTPDANYQDSLLGKAFHFPLPSHMKIKVPADSLQRCAQEFQYNDESIYSLLEYGVIIPDTYALLHVYFNIQDKGLISHILQGVQKAEGFTILENPDQIKTTIFPVDLCYSPKYLRHEEHRSFNREKGKAILSSEKFSITGQIIGIKKDKYYKGKRVQLIITPVGISY